MLKHDKIVKRVSNPGKTFKFTYGDPADGFNINSCKYKNSVFIKFQASVDSKIKMQSSLTEIVINKDNGPKRAKNNDILSKAMDQTLKKIEN